ncbi:MAG: NAD-dependent epimerase/dehydratase family protein [Gammaproteobacteria bacterium]|nr:NAD-dependent epimerase/dehydratase family protein [Gammaproteobacteria bacterium]
MSRNVSDYVFPEGDFDLFIHGATDTSPDAIASPLQLLQSMIDGTKHVLDHAILSKVQRVLMISSGAVYGEQPKYMDKLSEDEYYVGSSLDVNNVYGEGKRAMEMLGACYADAYDIEIITARCFAFVGYGLPKHLAIGQLINDALYVDEITVKGMAHRFEAISIFADLAVWLLTILTRGETAQAYNVGSDVGMTISELAKLVTATLAPEKIIRIRKCFTKDKAGETGLCT